MKRTRCGKGGDKLRALQLAVRIALQVQVKRDGTLVLRWK